MSCLLLLLTALKCRGDQPLNGAGGIVGHIRLHRWIVKPDDLWCPFQTQNSMVPRTFSLELNIMSALTFDYVGFDNMVFEAYLGILG